jgi:hypothetical protein
MDGKAANEIYAVGFAESDSGQYKYKGIIMHYDGKSWEQVNLPDLRVIFGQIYYNQETDEYLIMGLINETGENMIYLFDRKSLKEILRNKNGYCLNKMVGKIYLNDGSQKIYRYDKSQFNLFKDFTGTIYGGRIWGRSEVDFFTENRDGIGHYNGTDIITIFKEFSNEWTMNELIVFDNEVFSTWQDLITVSIHGKLK